MFDNIGRDLDPDAARRRATSLFLTTCACAAGVGLVVGYAAMVAGAAAPPVVEDDGGEMVMLDPVPEEALPPLPAAPAAPPPPAGSAEPDASETPEIPDELIDEIQALQDHVPHTVVEPDPAPGTPDGHAQGHPDGVSGGTPGGDPEGRCGGPGEPACGEGQRVRVFHHSELEVRRRIEPAYPDAARALGLSEERCLVTVLVDENGVPYDATVDRCPKVFHAASREAVLKWRWFPPKDGKQRVRARTTIAITYRLD